MLRLINPNLGPVGGIRFKDPDTAYEYNKSYKSFEELEQHVKQHRDQNKLPPIDDFRQVWENWVCHEFGMKNKCCPVTAEIARTFEQYIQGAKAFVRRAISKDPFVTKEVAEARAAICLDCDQNLVNIGHRMSQHYSNSFIRSQTKGRSARNDKELYTCKICTCLLRSKIHYPAPEVAASLSDTELGLLHRKPKSISTGRHLHCWQIDCVDEVKKQA